jgi:hypothetical protein
MRRLLLVVMLLACSWQSAQAQMEVAREKRRVYVLHSGMHIVLAPRDKDFAARTMKQLLQERGIPKRDIVALDSPFPTASWSDPVPRDGLLIYLGSADPSSRASADAYVRLHKALQAQEVNPTDEIVWIGHSAGGQMGMTMANLAHNLHKYPELAKKTQPYSFQMVITLGSPVGKNLVPDGVKLRHYHSDGDTMVYFLAKHGDILPEAIDSKIRLRPCHELRANALMRVYPGVEHGEWFMKDAVLSRILCEFDPQYCPAWRRTQADTSRAMGLAQLLAKALEAECRISLEEPQH